jgi:translocation and assembly module TamB
VKRFLVYGIGLLLAAVVLVGAIALKWLMESPDGLQWLFQVVSRQGGVAVSARSIQGGIGSPLRLEGFSLRWGSGDLSVKKMDLRWQPLTLPFGTVAIQELTLQGVTYQDNSPESAAPAELSWPRITGLPTRLNARIDSLVMRDISYQVRRTPPVVIPVITAVAAWRGGQLDLSRLELQSGWGRFTGYASAGFVQPLLRTGLVYEPLHPVAGCSRFEVHTHFVAGTLPEILTGELKVTALHGKTPRYRLSADGRIATNVLTFNAISLTETGRRGTITGSGSYLMSGTSRLRLRLAGVDLSREAGRKLNLSGTVVVSGTPEKYTGQLDLTGAGDAWLNAQLKSSFRGTGDELDLSGLDASYLNGSIRGSAHVGWRNDPEVSGALQGRGLDPALVAPGWSGVVNFDTTGRAVWKGDSLNHAELAGTLIESRLHDRALSGEVAATLDRDNLRISRLFLTGSGFDLRADGEFRERLNFSAHVTELSALLPGSSGALDLQGWGRYREGAVQGTFAGQGRGLAAEGVQVESATVKGRVDSRPDHASDVSAELQGIDYNGVHASSASLGAAGTVGSHRISIALRTAGAHISGVLEGGYTAPLWKGKLTRFSGKDSVGPWQLSAPAALLFSPEELTVASLVITGASSEQLELSGRLFMQPLRGTVRTKWSSVDLARIGQWLPDIHLAGNTSGHLRGDSPDGKSLALAGQASATGSFTMEGQTVTIRRALLDFSGGDRGVDATLDFKTAEGITVSGRFTSPEPLSQKLPDQGELHASWQGVNPALAQRWLPPEVSIRGNLSGDVSGKLLPAGKFDLAGTVNLDDGGGRWRGDGKDFSLTFKKAALDWNWKDNSLNAALMLSLQERGEVRGVIRLPLPARIGAVLDPDGPITGSLKGSFREKGLLAGMFTGVVQESKGEVSADLEIGGTLKTPAFSGTLLLDKAGAYLPASGITLKEVRLAASLSENRVRIDSFRAVSGAGELTGNATLDFDGTILKGYKGVLTGTSFQAVYLPELLLLVSPELTFEGDREKLVVRGDIRIPELNYQARNSREVIKASRDVEIVGKTVVQKKQTGPTLDFQALLTLGERVFVKAEGLDARLEGAVVLHMRGAQDMTGTGEIRVAKGGIFTFYGTTLKIERGRAIFNGGVIGRPILDILAVRKIDEVKAGVTVTGTPESPFITLYSEPALPEVEILSYVVLGQKMSESGDQLALLTTAASMLTSSRDATPMTEQVKQQFGLDTLGLTTGKEAQTGYKAIEPSLTSSTSATTDANSMTDSMFQIGKYLTPKLYISYGKSIFSDVQQVQARYSFTKRLEVESKLSTEASGGDIFYRFEFD